MNVQRVFRLGTRNSQLARWQAQWVAQTLGSLGYAIQLVPITTTGDANSSPMAQIGTVGVFTKEIQRELLCDRIDLAVHSLKDLPTDVIPNLSLVAVPGREDARDVLVAGDKMTLAALPTGARVGTSSLRRQAQLLALRPDLQMHDIRGNLDTRIHKLKQGQFDALVLAYAGIKRSGLEAHISEVFSLQQILPAVSQGALGIEVRTDDTELVQAVSQLNDADSWAAVTAERAMLARLLGGCMAPVGAIAQVVDQQLQLTAVVLDRRGESKVTAQESGPLEEPVELGQKVADRLNDAGASALIAACRA